MDEPEQVVVEWDGPYSLSAFIGDTALKERFDKPGVYIWIETLPDGTCRLAYVGRATGRPTLWKRQMQHYAYMVGGLYMIPKEFRADGTAWVPDWTRLETARTLLDRPKFAAVIDDAFRYAAACQVYLWVVPPGTDVRIVERNLLYDFKPTSTDWGKGSSPGCRLTLCHRSPRWLTPEIRAQVRRDVRFV
jgi:hypothetical protein